MSRFPGATEKLQWGDALCFKVSLKMFAVLGLDQVRLTFKCTQETFAELIEREDITPAPYVGRYNWVMLHRLEALPKGELKDLIQRSYEIVAARAPKKRKPSSDSGSKKMPTKKTVRPRKAKKRK